MTPIYSKPKMKSKTIKKAEAATGRVVNPKTKAKTPVHKSNQPPKGIDLRTGKILRLSKQKTM